jgi:succinoglycan biosynthesis protein ExoM
LLESGILKGSEPVFRPEFGTGGEDQDFFRRMIERGHVFIWCDEAAVYEVVPRHRWGKRFLLKRALLRGKTTFRHPRDRVRNIAKSLVAVPSYTLALPFLLLLGQHHFMRYLVRLFDHLGRLLALVNLNPIKERCN